jgi:glycosyltransferase involved in cell wall biosynthesis
MSLRRFDVLVSFELFEHIWDWPVETLPAKTICVIHDTIPLRIDEGPNARPDHFFRCCARPVIRADRLVCVSKSSERDLLAFFPNAKGRTEVIYNGHDLETFGQRELPSAARNPEACRLLMVGDIDRRKNVQNVLRAIPTIKRMLPLCSIELVIVGKNEHEAIFSHLTKIANELGTVKWVGYVPDKNIIDYYRSADVFLFPSLWEGFGIPVLEAMSAGVPVVCSDLSSLPEVGGAHVEYCDPYDPPSIAEAVVRVLKLSPEERQQRIGDARAWAATFTWERSAQQLTQIIRQLAASPKSMHAQAERLPNRGAENP